MVELKNPFVELENYNCFGCAQQNKKGLQLKFFEEDDKIISFYEAEEYLVGYYPVLHGGIQATLLDEIASWVVFIKLQTAGVTSRLNVTYRKPAYVNQGKLRIEASLVNTHKHIAEIKTALYLNKTKCSEATVFYYIFDKKTAAEKLDYPGIDAFYYDKKV